MRLSPLLLALSALLWTSNATNNGLTTVVSWDTYSLTVNGSRVFIYSAEFHYGRIPVPEMWLEILQKFKANGFNCISVYFFWSYHSASKGAYDFTTSGKNIQRLFDYAKQVGLYIIARPGPYVNGETNAGGYALHGSDGSFGKLRTNDETYHQAWLPWVTNLGKILAQNEVTKGGPVILSQVENELIESSHSATSDLVLYMEQLEAAYRAAGMTVPFTSNEKGERGQSWSVDYENVGGAVNVYGLDSYPGGLSCTNPNAGFAVSRSYYQWFLSYSHSQPGFLPEFQGGYFQSWGGTFYDDCTSEHYPEFADVYYKNNIGQKVTLQNIYMTFGGTNWGNLAAPVVYTSYDYGAPMRETRQIRTKLSQTKLVGLFTRVSTDLLKTNMVGNGAGYDVSSTGVYAWVLRNPDTSAGFTVVQQATTGSKTSVTFSATLTTTSGKVTVPNINLNGRQSKILVTDYKFGSSNTLLYCSADILIYGNFDVDVLVLYLNEGQTGQFELKSSSTMVTSKVYGSSLLTSTGSTFTYSQGAGQTAVKLSNGVLLYLLDLPSAYKFFAPTTTANPNVDPSKQIFVLGPYLVRTASVASGVVYVSGDNDNSTTLEVYTGDSTVQAINWNGKNLVTTKTAYGSLTAPIAGAENRVPALPKLTNWHAADSLPEKSASYDDSKWTICNKTSTPSPVKPSSYPVLYSSDYGFYAGAKVYRGYFDGSSSSASISCSGGDAFGWNAWLNGVLIGGNQGAAAVESSSASLSLPSSALQSSNNVITVVVDYTGHDEGTGQGVANPRGILSASLSGKSFKEWKIAGNAGGNANIDPVRGPMNEGALYSERLGWHLPGFPVSSLPVSSSIPSTSSPMTGISGAGIAFYVTTFELNFDPDLDVPIGVEFSASSGTVARVMLWVNGYQFGKYTPHIGPQTTFPVPPGVINNNGTNTLAVSLWAQTSAGAKLSAVNLVQYGAYQTNFPFSQDWSYLQPSYTDRAKYA